MWKLKSEKPNKTIKMSKMYVTRERLTGSVPMAFRVCELSIGTSNGIYINFCKSRIPFVDICRFVEVKIL